MGRLAKVGHDKLLTIVVRVGPLLGTTFFLRVIKRLLRVGRVSMIGHHV
jgi:hypothetical protein